MQSTYVYPHYAPVPVTDPGARHPVVVVGGGLVGLTAALDLARRGRRVVLLDDDDTVSVGSRAICFAKRTLEIFGRLGSAQRCSTRASPGMSAGCSSATAGLSNSTCCPRPATRSRPSSTCSNITSSEWLVEACQATGLVDLRWQQPGAGVAHDADGVALTIEAPDGSYALTADWLLACDGAHSLVREMPGPAVRRPGVPRPLPDRRRDDAAGFPAERWFWFDPPFHRGGSVLLHRQADDVWRIDFQLGWDADPEAESDPERVRAAGARHAGAGRRVRAGMGQHLHVPLPPAGAVPPRPRASSSAMRRIR